MNNIPTEEDWGDYCNDFDQKSAYKTFFGKSNEEMQSLFYDDGNEIMTEIRFMPVIPFRYYILGFRDFILKNNFPPYEASNITSYFLEMIEIMLKEKSDIISPIMKDLIPAIDKVARSQDTYDAPTDIYGNYLDKLSNIKELCSKHLIELKE